MHPRGQALAGKVAGDIVSTPFIPPRTRLELASPAAPGGRHEQMIKIAVSLIGNGLSPQAVFAELRSKYDPAAKSDVEIERVIAWAVAKNPAPSGYGNRVYQRSPARPAPRPALQATAESASAAVEAFLKDFRCDDSNLRHRSPWRPLEAWRVDSIVLFAALYLGHEYVNVVTDHIEGKPVGAGVTMLRDDWMRCFRKHGTPQSKAGAWFRFNPITEKGSGKAGAICDADVTAHRFALLESDKLPMELQLAFFGKLRLPISAIYLSGGKSAHCLVRMDCADVDEYREQVARILKILAPYGFDGANKNPSRLSRLPGAIRQIGAKGDGEQRLLYLNPDPVEGERIFP